MKRVNCPSGPPWRACDIFDSVYSKLGEELAQEQHNPHLVLPHIQELAKALYNNENICLTNGQNYSQRIPLPTEGHMTRVHQPIFPTLDPALVSRIIQENLAENNKSQLPSTSSSQNKLVPLGQRLSGDHIHLVPNSARRLEVLRNCITNIFENKISDAKKTFPAVIRALKSKAAR